MNTDNNGRSSPSPNAALSVTVKSKDSQKEANFISSEKQTAVMFVGAITTVVGTVADEIFSNTCTIVASELGAITVG